MSQIFFYLIFIKQVWLFYHLQNLKSNPIKICKEVHNLAQYVPFLDFSFLLKILIMIREFITWHHKWTTSTTSHNFIFRWFISCFFFLKNSFLFFFIFLTHKGTLRNILTFNISMTFWFLQHCLSLFNFILNIIFSFIY